MSAVISVSCHMMSAVISVSCHMMSAVMSTVISVRYVRSCDEYLLMSM